MDIKTIAIFSSLMLTASTYANEFQPKNYFHMTPDKVKKVLENPIYDEDLAPGAKEFCFTRVLDFSNDLSLTELPEHMLFQALDLRELNLSGCKNLKRLPESLKYIGIDSYTLNITGCTGLIRDESFYQLISQLTRLGIRVLEEHEPENDLKTYPANSFFN